VKLSPTRARFKSAHLIWMKIQGSHLLELDGRKSGKYGKPLIRMMLSYNDGCNSVAIAFEIRTAICKM